MDVDELVFHPWTVQGPRRVPNIVAGSGSHVIDSNGRRYLDFSSQLVFTKHAVRMARLQPAHPRSLRPTAPTTARRRPRST